MPSRNERGVGRFAPPGGRLGGTDADPSPRIARSGGRHRRRDRHPRPPPPDAARCARAAVWGGGECRSAPRGCVGRRLPVAAGTRCSDRLRGCVARSDRLVSSIGASGYMLTVERAAVDSFRFDELTAAGRAAMGNGDPVRASALVSEALGLWRGDALVDFAYENFAEVEIARLSEARLAAIEVRIDADLALGRHAALVAELDCIVTEFPLRERLRARNRWSCSCDRGGRPRRFGRTSRHELCSPTSWDSSRHTSSESSRPRSCDKTSPSSPRRYRHLRGANESADPAHIVDRPHRRARRTADAATNAEAGDAGRPRWIRQDALRARVGAGVAP